MTVATAEGIDAAAPLHNEQVPVSVICTARNAAPTIEATIRSILAQDFQNWEMIIVDDGSTDDTLSIVSRLAETDPRIRLVATEGIGRGPALNRALAAARADLVANIDADDESHPYRLRCQLEAMRRHPEFAIVATEWVRVDGAARPVWPEIDAGASFEVEEVTRSLAISNPICHSSAMMRTAAVVGLGGYDEARQAVFDYDLWVRSAAAGLQLGRIQLPLVAKRIHPGQSYLHAARLRYLWAILQVQARAMRTLGFRTWHLPVIVLRLLWLTLPLSVRHTLNRAGAGRRLGQTTRPR